MLHYILAVLSGLLAASNAALSKFARKKNFGVFIIDSQLSQTYLSLLHFGTYLLGNAFMWLTYVTALKKSRNTVTVVVLNNISNFLLSAFYGWWYFAEMVSATWCLGTLCVASGCYLLHSSNKHKKTE